ncbi:MAG: agmatine deiminase [Aquidulcibacter sp.]|jgi:agmatine deiminase|uniref:agmatine deiminase n=1 Tax=Aquidulcibacter sp. TaxID=2052990 RepID=UPI0022C4A38F|nr:agmatine deiminase [Aquidulcibacter sp.]
MTRTLTSNPKHDGFFMPAEWSPHAGTWMLWPERTDNWRNDAGPAQAAFADVAKAIAAHEPVTMCVSPAQYLAARSLLPARVRVVEMTSNDSWIRDCGPTFLTNGHNHTRGVDWRFNAWGGETEGLYKPWDQDDLVGEKVLEMERAVRYAPPIILEGGSIEVDGQGTLITTRQCLLNKNRNPDLTRGEIETALKNYLGVEAIIWLDRGVYQDETDGHADNLARFVAPGKVALTWTDDTSDPEYAISQDAYKRLSKARDANGRELEILKLHQPGPLFMTHQEAQGVDHMEGTEPRRAGGRLAGSYVNFYICNGAVIVPALDPVRDCAAKASLATAFPLHEIVMVPAREILLGGGNIHCITQQQPKGIAG